MRETRFSQRITATEIIEPGDVIRDIGPRIGERYWLVVDVSEARIWRWAICQLLDPEDVAQALLDATGSPPWTIDRYTTAKG